MKIKFKILAIVLIGVLTLGAYNMGLRNNAVAEEEEKQTYYQTENVYLWYTDDAFTEYFTGAAVAFHEANPGIRVIPQLVVGDGYLEYINKASIEGENFPDVYITTNDALEKAYLAGLASEVDPFKLTVSKNHFPSAARNAVTYDDKFIGYPLFFETSVLVYNKTYLMDWLEKVKEEGKKEEEQLSEEEILAEGGIIGGEEGETTSEEATEEYNYETITIHDLIPETIEDIKKFADDYDAPEGVDGVFKWDVSDVFYNYFFVGKYMNVGGPAGDREDDINIYNPQTIRCMNIYQQLNQFFSIDADESSYDKMIDDFIHGKFVFSIATSDVIKRLEDAKVEAEEKHAEDLEEYEKTKKELDSQLSSEEIDQDKYDEKLANAEKKITPVYDFGYARIPDLDEELKSGSLSVTDALIINNYSEHKDAANKFAAFASTEYSKNLYAKTGKIAASYDASYSADELKLFQSEYADSVPLTKVVEANNFWVQLEITFTEIWTGEDSDELLRKLSEQIMTQVTGKEYTEQKIKILGSQEEKEEETGGN